MSYEPTPNTADVILMLEKVTQLPPGQIHPNTELEFLHGWDSMGVIIFLSLVNDVWEVLVPPQELRTASTSTPQTVTELIQNHCMNRQHAIPHQD